MADDRKTPATPSLDAMKRMGSATRFYEQGYREEPLPKARGPRSITNGVKVAKTGGSGISAMVGARPGTGEVTLYTYAGPGNDAEITDPVVIVTISNLGKAVSANIFINVADGDGGWWVVVEPCP